MVDWDCKPVSFPHRGGMGLWAELPTRWHRYINRQGVGGMPLVSQKPLRSESTPLGGGCALLVSAGVCVWATPVLLSLLLLEWGAHHLFVEGLCLLAGG